MERLGIPQLEQATEIPNGSLCLIEMGDGSGTKTVTKETLIKETGESLKVGNLKELQTENKESLVGAINEAAQSGGGGASVDILDTPEEIEANTESGKVAGGLALKLMVAALNDDLRFPDGIGFYPDIQNGKYGFNTDPARGADTFTPFSSGTSGTLNMGFSFMTSMSPSGAGSGNGAVRVIIKDGVITSSQISGSGSGVTVGGSPNAYSCSVSSFKITSITWTPDK